MSGWARDVALIPILAATGNDSRSLFRRGFLVSLARCLFCGVFLVISAANAAAYPAPRTPRDKKSNVPEGFAIDLKTSEADVTKAVQYVIQDQIIHGTQMYARED